MRNDKAPRPDGFSAGFLKKNWLLIGRELCQSIRHFFKYNDMPTGINLATLALIRKTDQATKLEDFSPISCCSVVYKIITYILADGLKSVLPDLIDIAQGAFISDRSIVDDLFIFSNGRKEAVHAIQTVVDKFLSCSGLSINLDKSQFFVAGMNDEKKLWIESCMGSRISSLPVKYLGVALNCKGIRGNDCSALIDSVKKRLQSWNNRFLSRAGRVVLIKSVL
ncbi:hypothetical protein QQ045_005789 [Rhodiola kirilowii]